MEGFSAAFDLIADDWEEFHDDYADLFREAADLDDAALLAHLGRLIRQFGAISTAIVRLPTAEDAEDAAETLEDAAEAESTALTNLYDTLALAIEEATSADDENNDQGQGDDDGESNSQDQDDAQPAKGSGEVIEPFLVAISAAIVAAETTLKEVSRDIHAALDRTSAADLEDVRVFTGGYKELLAQWDAFHARYDDWRRTEGGCGPQ